MSIKRLFLFVNLAVFGFVTHLVAQTNPADGCTGIPSLTVNSSCSPNNYTLSGSYSNGGLSIASCSGGQNKDDGWYSFTAVGTSTTVELTGNRNHTIAAYSSCAAGQLACNYQNSGVTATITFTTVAGTVYYLQVHRNSGNNGADMTGTICVYGAASVAQPDDCGSALDLSTLTAPYSESTSTAVNDYSFCSMGSAPDHIYYIDLADGATLNIQQTTNNYDSRHSLRYGGACPGTTEIVCTDDSDTQLESWQNCTGSTQRVYWIQSGFGSNLGDYTITWSVVLGSCPATPVNDECINATSLTVNPDLLCGTTTSGTVDLATASAQANGCFGTADDDVWYSFVATSSVHHIEILNVAGSVTDMYHSVYAGTCSAPGAEIVCSDPNNSIVTGLTPSNTYLIRVYTYTSTGGQNTVFDICVGTPPPAPANDDCAGAYSLTMNGLTCTAVTSAYTNSATQSMGSGSCFGTPDDDVWFSFVATGSTHNFEVSNIVGTSTDMYHEVFSGSCGSLTSMGCSDPNTSSFNGFTPGNTYYVRVYTYWSGDESSFDFCVSDPCPSGPPTNNDPCSATSLTTGASCTYSLYSNDCSSGSSVPNPGCASYVGSDVWFTATVPASGHLIINSNIGVVTDGGMALYSGSCGSLTFLECDDLDSPNGNMPMIDRCNLTPGSVVYIRFWEDGGDNNGTFSICVYDGGAPGACSTDQVIASLPFSQTGMNTAGFGDDFSSSSTCLSSYMNGDDYVFEYACPADEDITITLLNTGTWVGVFVTEGCPSDACSFCVPENSGLGCGSSSSTNTSSSGNPYGTFSLVGGRTYYITVSTFPSPQTTPFDIYITTALPGVGGVVPQQDCVVPQPVCSSMLSAPNPGFSGTGNTCDFSGSGNCLGSGEKESAWYLIDIAANGTLYFNIVPNDGGPGSCGSETDYDFAVWKVAGVGATDCATIQSTGGAGDVACNYSWYGVTGCGPGGSPPAPYNACFAAAYDPGIPVVAGEQYLLVVQNWTINSSGFILDFTPTAAGVINYSTPSTLLWTGQNGTSWTDPVDWGSCGTPSCTVDANIAYSALGQPVITTNVSAKDVTINTGATLTLNAGVTLSICGDFTNNGTLIADPTSTIEFIGTGAQSLNGSITGVNKMPNVVVNKASGVLTLNTNVEVDQVMTLTAGEVNLNSNTLTLLYGSTIAITRTNGYILSESQSSIIQWNTDANADAYVFPFGYLGTYIPFTFDKNAVVPSNISISTFHTSVDNQTPMIAGTVLSPAVGSSDYVDRWWDITPSPAVEGDLTFEFTTAEISGVSLATPLSQHWNSGMGSFEALAGWTGGCVTNCVHSTWTSFSGGGVGGDASLPIELLSFSGVHEEGQNHISWVTSSEINNDFFTLERTVDGLEYTTVGTISGAGNSNSPIQYEFWDSSPIEGVKNYYRLKQTDFDGTITSSMNIGIYVPKMDELITATIYPNPAQNVLTFEFSSFIEADCSVTIRDLSGRVLISDNVELNKGDIKQQLDISTLANGVYLVMLINDDRVIRAEKLIKN